MSISVKRYVNITSGAGASSGVAVRDLVLRVFTQNPLVPADHVTTITNATDAGVFFGTTSDEYAIALKYFSFVSKNITSPQKMSFARWNPTAIAPVIYGDPATVKQLSAFVAVTAGLLDIDVDGVVESFTGIDFSTATTLAQVATILQTEIQGGTDPQFATATVQYDTNTTAFILTGSVPGAGLMKAKVVAGADISALLGWTTGGQIEAPGAAAQTAEESVALSANNDDNFGSFVYGGTVLPTDPELVKVSAWNATQNNSYVFCMPVSPANALTQQILVKGNEGTALTLVDISTIGDHSGTIPAEILAGTDYSRAGASANYMF